MGKLSSVEGNRRRATFGLFRSSTNHSDTNRSVSIASNEMPLMSHSRSKKNLKLTESTPLAASSISEHISEREKQILQKIREKFPLGAILECSGGPGTVFFVGLYATRTLVIVPEHIESCMRNDLDT